MSRNQSTFGLHLMALLMIAAETYAMGYCDGWMKMPCSCNVQSERHILIQCQDMNSFGEIVEGLKNDFSPKKIITLEIDNSKLDDLHHRSFKELNMTIVNLKLNNSGLRHVHPYSFAGLTAVQFFSLADNPIPYIPTMVIREMPNIATLDLGRMKIRYLREDSLDGLGKVQSLLLPGNLIEEIDTNSIPTNVTRLHLGHNRLRHLNGTLRHLNELIWLFVNDNQLTSLDNQLPRNGSKMNLLHAAQNKIQKLPHEIRHLPALHSLFMHENRITTLDGILAKCRMLARLNLQHNRLKMLGEDDFAETIHLQYLYLGYNHLTSLNNSMHSLINLVSLNVSHNRLEEFSFEEMKGLDSLTTLDLSSNHIHHLIGFTMNSLEWESNLSELYLDHNDIHQLNGAVSGFRKLIRLNASYNKISRISPDDFIGLENLELLDVSHNHLTTLEETSKTYLPKLQELLVSHNYLTVLDKDFHGLPVLCWADLSYNQIVEIGRDLVSKTHCKFNDSLHSALFRDLLIELEDNPILCNASYPEFRVAMESNHTKISGSATCPLLIEQPITQTNHLGYGQDTTQQPLVELKQPLHIETPYLNHPLFNMPYNSITDISNQVRKSISDASSEGLNNHHNQIQPEQITRDVDPTNFSSIRVQEQIFVPLPEQYQPGKVETDPPKLVEPIPYQHQHYMNNQDETIVKVRFGETVDMNNKPLNGQHVYAHIDAVLQEQQLSQLASEIEQLRAKVEELASENQRLSLNLNQQNLEIANDKFFENTRPILPLAQVPALSTVKPPIEEYERTP